MTLAANNITPRLANTELGAPFGATPSNLSVGDVCGYGTQNKYSFYGPGTLSTDGSKDVVHTIPSNNYKLGDFRSYNNGAATPAAATNWTQNWGPGGSSKTITVASLPSEVNVLEADSGATYITYRMYLSTGARTSQTPLHGSSTTNSAQFTGITPLIGHTRNQSSKIHATHVDTSVTLTTTGLSTPDDFVYMDTFFSNVSGTRLLNLGSVSGGYTTITTHELQTPWVDSNGTCVSRGGYTGSHTEINNVSSSCTGADVNMSVGTNTYSFYLRAVGIATGIWNIGPSNCTVQLVHYDGDDNIRQTKTLTTVNLNSGSKNGVQIASGVYGTLSNNWALDDYMEVNVTAVASWGTAYAC